MEGAIPAGLQGRYIRNGPNPRGGDPRHWFFGDGMIHGVEVRDGRANWYRNRWVRTRSFLEGPCDIAPDGSIDLANTNVVSHAGRLLALVETAGPTEITRDLATAGRYDYGGQLTTPMTAHPKVCPTTGELHFFGYRCLPPYLTYHRVDKSGALVQSEVVNVSRPTMMHDFALTARHVIVMDLLPGQFLR